MRKLRDRVDVQHVHARIAQRFDIYRFRVFVKILPIGLHVILVIDKTSLDPVLRQYILQKIRGPAVKRLHGDDVVPGPAQIQESS